MKNNYDVFYFVKEHKLLTLLSKSLLFEQRNLNTKMGWGGIFCLMGNLLEASLVNSVKVCFTRPHCEVLLHAILNIIL